MPPLFYSNCIPFRFPVSDRVYTQVGRRNSDFYDTATKLPSHPPIHAVHFFFISFFLNARKNRYLYTPFPFCPNVITTYHSYSSSPSLPTILPQIPLQSSASRTIANPLTTGKCQALTQNNLLAFLPSPPAIHPQLYYPPKTLRP